MLGLLLLGLVLASAPKRKLTIINSEPMTGGWTAGASMLESIRFTTDLINANDAILPDYDLEVIPYNDECDPDVAERAILDLFFNGNVEKMEFKTKPDGSINMFEWDTVSSNFGLMGASEYVAIMGAGCSGATMAIAKIVSKARKPLLSMGATSPALSDRSLYPFFWRAPQPDTNSLRAMAEIAATLSDAVAVWSSPSSDGWTKAILGTLLPSGLKVTGGQPFPQESGLCFAVCGAGLEGSTACKSCRGYYIMDYDFEAGGLTEVENLVLSFKRNPTRVNFLSLNGNAQAAVLCELKKAGVEGVVVFGLAWALPTVTNVQALTGSEQFECDWDDIKGQLVGTLGVGAVNQRVDKGTQFGCDKSVDPTDLNAEIMALVDQVDASGMPPSDKDYVGPAADALCIFALAYHELLYTDGLPYESLFDMSEDVYIQTQDKLGATKFEGLTGPVQYVYQGDEVKTPRFPEGLVGPDPAGMSNVWQVAEDTVVVVLPPTGVVAEAGVDWKVNALTFRGFNGALETVAPGTQIAKYAECEEGFALDFFTNTCKGCPAGSFPNFGACELCRAGEISSAGDAACTSCPAGTSAAAAGSTVCTPCAVGLVAQANGASECVGCSAGFFPNEAADACKQCVHGTFSAAGQGKCTRCDPFADAAEGTPEYGKRTFFSTLTTGATASTSCTCAVGMFWNVRDDKCEPCRDEAFCAGGLHLPVVYQGKYGHYLGSVAAHDAAKAAKQASEQAWRAFAAAHQVDAFYDVEVYNCASAVHCPGEDIEFDFAKYGLPRTTQEAVRRGAPLSGACPPLRDGIACAKCDTGYYGSGDCLECSGAAGGVNVAILIIFPFIMLSLYRGTTSAGTQRLQSAFILVSTCGMAAFFMQTIAVLDTFAFEWPSEIAWLFEISRIFMFDLGGLSLSCMHGNSFAAKYWASILIPLFVIAMTCVGFAISKVLPLPEPWKMKPNHTFSMVGMFMSALYITLVKVVLAYFECPSNPYAPDPANIGEHYGTLAKYKDVVCGEDEHTEAVAPMVLGLVFYVVGFYFAFCWAAYSAPKHWADVGFRERWKFMLTRWRPDVWYWGTVVMTRNLLVAFAGVLSSEPRVQLVYVVAVVLIVLAITAAYQPWRAPALNTYDVLSSIILCFIGILGLIFVSVEEEIGYVKRLELTTIAERKTEMRDAFATSMTVMVSLFMALFFLLLGWTLTMMLPGQAKKLAVEQEKKCKVLWKLVEGCTQSTNFAVEAERLIHEATDYDRAGLHNFMSKIGVDQLSQASGTTDTISMNKAKASGKVADNAPHTVSA